MAPNFSKSIGMSNMSCEECWITLAEDDRTAKLAMVLAKSLRRMATTRKIAVVVNDDVSEEYRAKLQYVFDQCIKLCMPCQRNGAPLRFYVKVFCWSMPFVRKCVFLDYNTMVLKNCDDLFNYPGTAATFDKSDILETSVLVFEPSYDDYLDLCNWLRSGKLHNVHGTLLDVQFGKWIMKRKRFSQLSPKFNIDACLKGKTINRIDSDIQIVRFSGCHPIDLVEDSGIEKMAVIEKALVSYWARIHKQDVVPILNMVLPITPPMQKTCVEAFPGITQSILDGNKEPIAIIGMSCRFPEAKNLEEYWHVLENGIDCIKKVPEHRWPSATEEEFREVQAGFLNVPVDEFDGKFFNISPFELSHTDPQQRLLLEVSWEALEHAGINPQTLTGSNTGIFVGTWTQDYRDLIKNVNGEFSDFHRTYMGNSLGGTSGRLSFILGLNGPNIASESGCSSSMVAVYLAVDSLRKRRSDIALAAGANLLLHPFQKKHMVNVVSPDGRCKTFDENCDGFGRAEGVATLVLKRYSDALKDGDNILSLIRGCGISQEGTSRSFGTPTKEGQEVAMIAALKDAGVRPEDISYVEAHGTGTVVGDVTEMAAITNLYCDNERDSPLLVASGKTNIGHTESCSGIAGIIKVILSMQHKTIPPHINLNTLNPHIKLDNIPVRIPKTLERWEAPDGRPRLAGVSSFGITGTNAHVILQEAPKYSFPKLELNTTDRSRHIVTFSAKTASSLDDVLLSYRMHLEGHPTDSLADLAFTCNTGRAHFQYRKAITAGNIEELSQKLISSSGKAHQAPENRPDTCFLFTGQGSHYVGMAKILYETSPVFRMHFDYCNTLLEETHKVSIIPALWPEQNSDLLQRSLYSQISIFCVEYCLMRLWESWGIKPDIVIGHSLGEFVAAVCAEMMSFEDALMLVTERSRLIEEKAPPGKMMVVKADKEMVDKLLQQFLEENSHVWLDYAGFNSPHQTVLAGPQKTIEMFEKFIQEKGGKLKTHVIQASSAFHSRDMDVIIPEYRNVIANVKQSMPSKVTYISGVTGKRLSEDDICMEYWVRHVREPVQFQEAVLTAAEQGCTLFLEIGAQPVLCALTMATLTQKSLTVLPSLRKSENEWNSILNTLAELYQLGFEIDWAGFDRHFNRKKVHLPVYPFSRKKHWYETRENKQNGIVFNTKSMHPVLGCHIPNATTNSIFQSAIDLEKLEYLKDHAIGGHVVFPAAGYLEMCLSAGCISTTGTKDFINPMSVENLTVETPLGMVSGESYNLQTVVNKEDSKISIYTQKTSPNCNDTTTTVSTKWVRQTVASFAPLQINYQLKDETEQLDEIKLRCSLSEETSEFYSNLVMLGLEFGNAFQSLKKVWKNSNGKEMLTEINIPESNGTYMTHPILIDAMIQSIMIGFKRPDNDKRSLFVPLSIGKVIIFTKSASQVYFGHCKWADDQSPDTRSATLYDHKGNIIAFMEGVQMIETSADIIAKNLTSKNVEIPNMYEEIWRPRMGPLKNRTNLKVMNGENIFGSEFANELAQCHKQTETHMEMVSNRRKLVYNYILKAFYELGWKPSLNEHLDVNGFMCDMGILATHHKLIQRYFAILSEEGIFESRTLLRVAQLPPSALKVEQDIVTCVNFITNHPQETGDAKVTIGCGERLASFLSGKESPLGFLFPEDKTREVCAETFYNESITVNAAHVALTSTVKRIMENYVSVSEEHRGVIRFLEIGAGTGSTTKRVLPLFDEFRAKFQYTFSDISPAFFLQARPKFEAYGNKIQYKVLNIEEDPISQGFIPGHYDIIMASNVLHATRDLSESVRHARSLLKENGLLLMVETLEPIREYDVVFGLLDGFWRFDDYDIRPDYPCASGTTWEMVCKKEGYDRYNYFSCFGGQVGVVVAGVSGTMQLSRGSIPERKVAKPTESWWLVFADSSGVVFDSYLKKMFQRAGRKVIIVRKGAAYGFNPDKNEFSVRQDMKDDFISVFTIIDSSKWKIDGIAYLWGLDKEDHDQLKVTTGFLFLAQILLSQFKGLPKFVLVTEGMMRIADESAVDITSSSLWGMVRSFRTEHFNLHVRSVDLDPDEIDLDIKYSELFTEFWNDDLEFQIAYRERSRHVCRLVLCKDFGNPLSLPNCERYSLKLPETKNIADLIFCPNGKAFLKGNDVDVEVRATGLNFRDVFVVLKPEKQFDKINCLGLEFAGVVVATGPEAKDLRVGDHVMGCKFADGALPSHVQMDEDLLFKMPNEMTFCEAATIPAAFATAYYCLVMIANLKKGETLLLHAASGGVGLFAVQVAKAVGANVIATAGSRRKRAFLRNLGIKHVFHSRNTDYSEQVHKLTDGKGVEVVLNSLTSPGFKEASLKVCCRSGRFVEMSKLHTWSVEEVRALRPDVDYNIVDLTTVDKPTWKSFWSTIQDYMKQGLLEPIPYTRFESCFIREALTYMQKARHIGKIIVAQPKMTIKDSCVEPDVKLFNESSTYLITGGVGGIGIELTKWMVNNGAKHIVLTSRRAPDTQAEKVIKELRSQGKNIVVMSVDVGNYDQCSRLFESMKDKSQNLPRLRGVFHCAGTLCDATYVNQTVESFQIAFHGKVYGAWNLHLLTKDYSLEHFVLFSSMVSILGPIGLANYAAANAYLDALCALRNALGLNAQCINWGQWSTVGAAKHINMPAVKPFAPHQGLLAFEVIIKSQKPQIAVLDVDFQYVRKLTSNVGTYLEELQITKGNQGVAFTVKIGNFWEDFNVCGDGEEEKKLDVIKSYVTTILRQILKFDDDEAIDENQNFSEMGMDSLMMLEMKNFLQTMLGKNITMNVSEMSELTTINKLTSHVLHLIKKSDENNSSSSEIYEQSTTSAESHHKPYASFSPELKEIVEKDMILPESIKLTGSACSPSEIRTVLLTGVTGKLGPYMLKYLLTRPLLKVICLIRANDITAANARLHKIFEEKKIRSLPQENYTVICGDVGKDKLGLEAAAYKNLASSVDAIVHCAVNANLMDPYVSSDGSKNNIRQVNVVGTKNILELAGKVKTKRVLHASTILACHKVTHDELLFEDWSSEEDVFHMTNMGYPVSKCVSEILAKHANTRGIPVQVHRFPGLAGDSEGIFSFPNNHAMLRLLGFCKLQAMPLIPVPLQFLPVDFAAEISCDIFFNEKASSGVYNLTNPKMNILQDFPQVAQEFGFSIDIVEYENFYERLSGNKELTTVFPYKEVDLENGRFIDFTLSPSVMRCWSKNPEQFFVSNKIAKLIPNYSDIVLSPVEILRRDMEYAKHNGIFAKMKLT